MLKLPNDRFSGKLSRHNKRHIQISDDEQKGYFLRFAGLNWDTTTEKCQSEFTFTIFEIIFHCRYRCRKSQVKFNKMNKNENRESFASHHNRLSDKFLGSGFTRRDERKI